VEERVDPSIRLETRNSGPVIVVSGDCDSAAAPHLDDAIRTASEANPNGTVAVDLSAAAFVDSRTMSVLVAWTERQRATGGALPIVCDNPNVLRVFRQIGLDDTLQIVNTFNDIPAPG
jgi:anti-sigma B factor antagonist